MEKKNFYCIFWDDIKIIFLTSLRESGCLKAVSTSRRNSIIRLIEKPNKDKWFIYNWRCISLPNINQKLRLKMLTDRLKKNLPFLIGPGHIACHAYDESGRLIADITETWNLEQLEGFLAAIDFEKAFGSLNLDFTITVLEHHGFGNEFIEWIKISLKMKNPV